MALEAKLLVLFLVGLVSGFMNVLAGGGSLLSLPILIFLGLPAATANGTNRVAILIQNLAAIAGFHRLQVLPWRLSLLAALPALVGALIGAHFAVAIPDALFKRLLAGIMVGVAVLMIIDPAKRLRERASAMTTTRRVLMMVGFFVVGLYGGFIQAGVGFIFILLMLVAGFDLVVTNAVKVLVIFLFTIVALAVFIWHGNVNYLLGCSLGIGSAVGAYIATKFAVKRGHAWIHAFVMVMIFVFAVKLVVESYMQ